MPSKQTTEIERLLSEGVASPTIAKRFHISSERVRQIKRKLLDPVVRCEQRHQNDVDEALSKQSAKFVGKMGGYLKLP